MTLTDLIAALERAEGPSREIDIRISRMLRPHTVEGGFPAYTSSLDAALSLVPEDVCWSVSVPRQPDMSGKRYWASLHGGHPGARGTTPAIALCIAALKARA